MATISIRLTTRPPYMVIDQTETFSELFSETEMKVLELVAGGIAQTLDKVISRIDGNALGAIRHLIFEGYLDLAAVTYPWGVEYELRLTESGRAYLQMPEADQDSEMIASRPARS